ncbi:MAG TPA: hypothetical protein PKJ95_00100 [Atribacterota bacterium]|nr:hypothetical protein [Atribacterota bacterium]
MNERIKNLLLSIRKWIINSKIKTGDIYLDYEKIEIKDHWSLNGKFEPITEEEFREVYELCAIKEKSEYEEYEKRRFLGEQAKKDFYDEPERGDLLMDSEIDRLKEEIEYRNKKIRELQDRVRELEEENEALNGTLEAWRDQ